MLNGKAFLACLVLVFADLSSGMQLLKIEHRVAFREWCLPGSVPWSRLSASANCPDRGDNQQSEQSAQNYFVKALVQHNGMESMACYAL